MKVLNSENRHLQALLVHELSITHIDRLVCTIARLLTALTATYKITFSKYTKYTITLLHWIDDYMYLRHTGWAIKKGAFAFSSPNREFFSAYAHFLHDARQNLF